MRADSPHDSAPSEEWRRWLRGLRPSTTKPSDPPLPCLICESPTFWRSIYGGDLQCSVCEPWPATGLVAERWTLATERDGTLTWEPCLRPGESARDRVAMAAAGCVAGDDEPSAADIAAACAEIQDTWSAREERQRREADIGPYTVPQLRQFAKGQRRYMDREDGAEA